MISKKKEPLLLIKYPTLLTWRASFSARGDESPSTLVSGLVTTAPPLGFYPFQPFLTPQFTLHCLHRQHQQSSSGTVHISLSSISLSSTYCTYTLVHTSIQRSMRTTVLLLTVLITMYICRTILLSTNGFLLSSVCEPSAQWFWLATYSPKTL